MPYIEITKDNFADLIEECDILIIDFWAPWCGPCRAFTPIFEKASEEFTDVTFAKCNTEDQREIASFLKIQAIPTLMVYREQELIFRNSGAVPEPQLKELLTKVMEIDMDEVREIIAEEKAKQAKEEAGSEEEGGADESDELVN